MARDQATREATQREAAQREAAEREAAQRAEARREADKREADARVAAFASASIDDGGEVTETEAEMLEALRDPARALRAANRIPAVWTHTIVCNMIVCMSVDRLSITLDPKLGAAARQAAKRARVSLSTWIAEATADRVRSEALGRALDRWEAEDGPFTAEELATATEALGLARKRKMRRR